MKTLQLLSFLLIFAFFPTDIFAQESEGDKAYVIQLATFGSWEDFAKNEDAFYTNTGTADNNIYAEQEGNRIKVYLFDSYEGGRAYFYAGSRLDKVLKEVRNNRHFKGAFRRSDVDINELTYYGDIFEQYRKNELPSEFISKGGSSTAINSTPKYKIQLGVFNEWKSLDYIADHYGLSETDKNKATRLLSHDFIKVNNTVCRRYYFGDYNSKQAAMAKKKALEKATKRKLMVVKI